MRFENLVHLEIRSNENGYPMILFDPKGLSMKFGFRSQDGTLDSMQGGIKVSYVSLYLSCRFPIIDI